MFINSGPFLEQLIWIKEVGYYGKNALLVENWTLFLEYLPGTRDTARGSSLSESKYGDLYVERKRTLKSDRSEFCCLLNI